MTQQLSLRFLGAAGTVTGSRYLLEAGPERILVDAGMFQGLKELRLRNWNPFPVPPESIDAVVLTHAHLDHCGYLPALVRDGFAGPIYGTEWTLKLAEVVLRDSARLQEEDAAYAARKGYSKHAQPRPLYDTKDVERCILQFREVQFRQAISIGSGFSCTWHPAGHVLGAAFVEVESGGRRLLFTGDLGRPEHPLLRPPDHIPDHQFDAVVTESTYGDRPHDNNIEDFAAAIIRTLKRGGSVLIPAFAVDRTEVILMEIRRLQDAQQIPRVPVYVDSPMALKTLNYYRQALRDGAPEMRPDMVEAVRSFDPFDAGTLSEVTDPEASKELNDPVEPCIIVSASGMATGGRVVHHLKGMLPDPKHSVLLVGYQAAGTRGRYLADGATAIKMYGQYVPVRAEVVQVGSFSVHADADELIDWLGELELPPTMAFVVHGEELAAEVFAKRLRKDLRWNAVIPRDGERVLI